MSGEECEERVVGKENLLIAASAVHGDLLPGGRVNDGDPLPLPGQGGGVVGGRRRLWRWQRVSKEESVLQPSRVIVNNTFWCNLNSPDFSTFGFKNLTILK